MIPTTDRTPLFRTHFADDSAWQDACNELMTPAPDMLQAFELIQMTNEHVADPTDLSDAMKFVDTVDDPKFDGHTPAQILDDLPKEYPHSVLFVFDETASSNGDHPLLVVDLVRHRGRTFRTLPSQVQHGLGRLRKLYW